MARRRHGEAREVVCPHCKKTFTPEPLAANQHRYQGFKCPHCRLFVASDRADEPAAEAGS
jgi:NAD-dependent SIR2 family protein deacetylase